MKLILSTKNQGKVEEFNWLARGSQVEFIALPSDIKAMPEETGSTFEENAFIKAKFAYDHCGLPSLADDSGLEVDYLNGAPGVLSARYSQEETDQSNMIKLLGKLQGVEATERTARFKCCLVLVTEKKILTTDGSLEGKIGDSLKGKNGFGYDPIFVLPQTGLHLAELNRDQKIEISHRSLAFKKMIKSLRTEL